MEASDGERRTPQARPQSWTARILAPLALVIAVAAVIAVVSSNLDDSGRDGRDGDGRSEATEGGCRPDAEQAVENGYYVIEPGEDLSVVADRTCIPIERLIALNENLDPQLLQVGSCVDLVRDGCKALAEQQ